MFNGNLVAASRLLFGIGRRGLISARVGEKSTGETRRRRLRWSASASQPQRVVFLGDAILVPISEVGSVAAAVGILAACASYYRIVKITRERCIAVLGCGVGLGMILMKVLPGVPGHFDRFEWLALIIWIALGAISARRPVVAT